MSESVNPAFAVNRLDVDSAISVHLRCSPIYGGLGCNVMLERPVRLVSATLDIIPYVVVKNDTFSVSLIRCNERCRGAVDRIE